MSRSILLIVCLICLGEIAFHNKVDAISKAQCVDTVKTLDNVKTFSHLADVLVPDHRELKEEEIDIVNRCIHSVDGYSDLKLLKGIVEQAATSSVCEPEYADQLLAVDKQLKSNASRGKHLKRKQTNRLLPFFRLFTGQVILTCKKSLAKKLESAEKNEVLVASLDLITEVSEARNAPIDDGNLKTLGAPMRKVLSLAVKYTPTVFNKAENIILVDSLKPTPDSELSIQMTFNTQESIEEFFEIKKACKKIEQYARGSIYTIPLLAMKGYLARDDTADLEKSLSEDARVLKWIQAVQYCQGALLVVANLDLDSDIVDKLDKEIVNDERIFTVNIAKESTGAIVNNPTHKFEQPDTFDSFDDNLKCYTQSRGLSGWLLKRAGAERLLARYLKLSVLDESIKQSLIARQEDPERDVQFASAVLHNGATTAGGHAATHLPWDTHASHLPLPKELAIGGAVILGCILAVALFVMCAKNSSWPGRDHPELARRRAAKEALRQAELDALQQDKPDPPHHPYHP